MLGASRPESSALANAPSKLGSGHEAPSMGGLVETASQRLNQWKAWGIELAEKNVAAHEAAHQQLLAMRGLVGSQLDLHASAIRAVRDAVIQWEEILGQMRNRGGLVVAASSPDLLEARVQVDPAVNVGWLGKLAN